MLILIILNLIAGLFSYFLATYIISQNPAKTTNRYLSLTLFFLAIWSFTSAASFDYSHSNYTIQLFQKVGSIGWIFFIPFFFLFCLHISGYKNKKYSVILHTVIFSIAIILCIKQINESAILNYIRGEKFYHSLYCNNIWGNTFKVYVVTLLSIGILILIKVAKSKKDIVEKQQARIILLSSFIAIILGLITDLVLPLMGIRNIPEIASILTAFWGLGILYARIKYQFLGMGKVVSRIVNDITDCVIICDTNNIIQDVNKITNQILGFSRDELIGHDISDFIQDENLFLKEQQSLKSNSEFYHPNVIIRNRTGQERIFNLSISLLKNKFGNFTGIIYLARDISDTIELIKLEKSHQESEQRFKDLVNMLPVIVYESDLQGNLTFANKLAFEKFGYSKNALKKGINIFDLLPENAKTKASKSITQVIKTGRTSDEEYTIFSADNNTIPVKMRSSVIIKNGNPAGLRGIIVDITKNKKLEKEISRRLRYETGLGNCLQTLLLDSFAEKTIQQVLYHLMTATKVDRVFQYRNIISNNKKMAELETEVFRTDSIDIKISDKLKTISYSTFSRWYEILSNDRNISNNIESFPAVEKEILEQLRIKSLLIIPIWKKNKLYGFIGFSNESDYRYWYDEDINILKTAAGMIGSYLGQKDDQNMLIRSEKWYKTIFENTGTASCIVENNGTISMVNSKFADTVGYKKSDIENKMSWQKFISKDEIKRLEKYQVERLKNNKSIPTVYELKLNIKNQIRFFLVNVGIIPDSQKRIISMSDITEEKMFEQKLLNAKEKAEEANKTKSRFLANISHEIRTPMNAIVGFADILYEDETNNDKKEKLELIKVAGKNLVYIINDILDLSKVEAGKLVIKKKNFNIKNACYHIYNLFYNQAKEKNLEFKITLSDSVPDTINADENRLTQIITNLISNAIKYTETGVISFNVDYTEKKLHIIVKDTGIGIPDDMKNLIFRPFEQLDSNITKTTAAGTGLGLTITKRLVDLLDGTIVFKSHENKGSEFKIIIPVEKTGSSNIAINGQSLVDSWIKFMRGDEELERLFLKGLSELPGQFKELNSVIKNDEIKKIRFISHDLKGKTGFCGMKELHKILENINLEAKKDDYNLDLINNSMIELDKIMKSIPKKYFCNNNTKKTAEIDGKKNDDFNILVAEDNKFNQELIDVIFKRRKQKYTLVGNGKEVIDILRKQKFDLIFLDIQMPVMDGIDTIQKIKENEEYHKIPVIALTAHSLEEEKQKYLDFGFNDVIIKPIDIPDFNNILDSYI